MQLEPQRVREVDIHVAECTLGDAFGLRGGLQSTSTLRARHDDRARGIFQLGTCCLALALGAENLGRGREHLSEPGRRRKGVQTAVTVATTQGLVGASGYLDAQVLVALGASRLEPVVVEFGGEAPAHDRRTATLVPVETKVVLFEILQPALPQAGRNLHLLQAGIAFGLPGGSVEHQGVPTCGTRGANLETAESGFWMCHYT